MTRDERARCLLRSLGRDDSEPMFETDVLAVSTQFGIVAANTVDTSLQARPGDPTVRHVVAWMRATFPRNAHAQEWASEIDRVFLRRNGVEEMGMIRVNGGFRVRAGSESPPEFWGRIGRVVALRSREAQLSFEDGHLVWFYDWFLEPAPSESNSEESGR